jgi:hypothetical protein
VQGGERERWEGWEGWEGWEKSRRPLASVLEVSRLPSLLPGEVGEAEVIGEEWATTTSHVSIDSV